MNLPVAPAADRQTAGVPAPPRATAMPTRQFDQMVEIFTKRGSALLEIRARAYRARAAASREDALEQLAQIEDLANQAVQNPEALRLELDELPAPGACPACGQQHEGRCMESLG